MKIKSAEFIKSGTNTSHMIEGDMPEFMFCGRSNVGKSSFINALVNRKALARTSSNPGKTQTLNLFLINNNIVFVDVPGYGYARVSKSLRETFEPMIRGYITNREQLKCAFLLVDMRHEPTNQDKEMLDFLRYYDVPVCIIGTKLDKLKRSEIEKNKKIIRNKLVLGINDPFIVTSSETKAGIEDLLNYIEELTTTNDNEKI